MTPTLSPDIRIRPYQPSDGDAFRALNVEWIAKYFSVEEQDLLVLNNPEGYVLKPGGHILMALADGRPVGCCALIPMDSGMFELGKMAVSEAYRGCGIGRMILEHTIAYAKTIGARSLYLETNTKLANAIHLYESCGFRHLPRGAVRTSPYARSEVAMRLDL